MYYIYRAKSEHSPFSCVNSLYASNVDLRSLKCLCVLTLTPEHVGIVMREWMFTSKLWVVEEVELSPLCMIPFWSSLLFDLRMQDLLPYCYC
jgi:hypothetical protein